VVRASAMEGIEELLERGEKIEHLVESTQLLADRSRNFSAAGRRLHHQMRWQHMQGRLLLAAVVVVVLLLFIFFSCGWGLCLFGTPSE